MFSIYRVLCRIYRTGVKRNFLFKTVRPVENFERNNFVNSRDGITYENHGVLFLNAALRQTTYVRQIL